MKHLVLILPFISLGSTLSAQNQDSLAIIKVISSYESTFNQKDPKAYANLFAEDADFVNWQGKIAHGRDSIEAFHIKTFKNLRTTQLKFIAHTVRFIKPDVATVDINLININMTTPDGKPLPNREVMLIWIMTKEGGEWFIKVNHTIMLNDGSKESNTKTTQK
jgi:uncharacterized protein (TIGR02246 family)